MAVPQGMPAAHPSNLSLRVAPAGWTAAALHERLHDFVKCALLQQLVPPGATVCDLYCGRGMDTEKWSRAQIGRYVGVDVASSALEEAREQWDSHNRPYPADFCEVDPCMADLHSELRHMGLPADFVCCMGHLQDSFFNEEMVKRLLLNVASVLKPGGYFFGTTADSSTLWSKYQKAVEGAHKAGSLRANGALPRVNSDHYAISFEDDRFTSFGTKYTLQFADAVISHNHVLVHFPSLIRLAEEVGLEYIEIQNLQEFYEEYRVQFFDTLRATCGNLLDARGRLMPFASDVLSLYTTFIFKKADPSEPGFTLSPLPLADEDQLEFSHEAHSRPGEDLLHSSCSSKLSFEYGNEEGEVDGQVAAEFYLNWSKAGMLEEVDFKRSDANKRLKLENGDLKEISQNLQKHFPDEIQHRDLDSVGTRPPGHLGPMDAVSEELHCVTDVDKIVSGRVQQDEENAMHCSVVDEINHGVHMAAEVNGSLHLKCGEDARIGFCTAAKPLRKEDTASIVALKLINPGGNTDRESKEQAEELLEASCSVEEPAIKFSLSCSGERCLAGVVKQVSSVENVSVHPLDGMTFSEHQVGQHANIDSGGKVVVGCYSGDLTGSKDVHAKEKLCPSTVFEKASATGETELDQHISKSSTGREHTRSKEHPWRSSQEPSSGQRRYGGSESSSKSYHHTSHLGDRREQSQGSRYSTSVSLTSHHSRASKDQGGEYRGRQVSTSHKVEDFRDGSRGAYNTPGHVRSFHMPQKGLAFYPLPITSPNDRGILGPGPPSLILAEPIRDLHPWRISKPPDRAVRPKARSSRSLLSDQKRSESPGWSKSPDGKSRESPPPGWSKSPDRKSRESPPPGWTKSPDRKSRESPPPGTEC